MGRMKRRHAADLCGEDVHYFTQPNTNAAFTLNCGTADFCPSSLRQLCRGVDAHVHISVLDLRMWTDGYTTNVLFMGLAQNEYMYTEEFTNAFRDFKNMKYPLYRNIFQFTRKYISLYVNV